MLTAEQQAGSQATHKGLTGALGKLEVRWRSSTAALGRLQTQQIMASSAAQKDVALTLCSLPQARSQSLSVGITTTSLLSLRCHALVCRHLQTEACHAT